MLKLCTFYSNNMKFINKDNWQRKEYFEFYSTFDDPFFGIVSQVECTSAYIRSKKHNISFFSYYLYCALKAVNEIDEFKYRIVENKIAYFDKIHCASTIGRADNSFAFSFCLYNSDFQQFSTNLSKEINAVQNSKGLRVDNDGFRLDVIYFSTIPWTTFTGIKHPFKSGSNESVPKITFGKIYEKNKKWFMPVSVDIHHGFADGYHAGIFFQKFQENLNTDFMDQE